MSKAELLARTKDFALRILSLVDHLPRTMSGRAIGSQLVQCGTSIGANYRAACRSRSRAEFAAKLGIVAEEADETVYLAGATARWELAIGSKIVWLIAGSE